PVCRISIVIGISPLSDCGSMNSATMFTTSVRCSRKPGGSEIWKPYELETKSFAQTNGGRRATTANKANPIRPQVTQLDIHLLPCRNNCPRRPKGSHAYLADPHACEHMPLAGLAAEILAAAHLLDDELLALYGPEHLGRYVRALHMRSAQLRVAFAA